MNHRHYLCPHSALGSRWADTGTWCPAEALAFAYAPPVRGQHTGRDLDDCVAVTFIAIEFDHSMNETHVTDSAKPNPAPCCTLIPLRRRQSCPRPWCACCHQDSQCRCG